MSVPGGIEKETINGHLANTAMPIMTMEAFAHTIGLPFSVFHAQYKRGYWPTTKIGKRVFVNVEAVRMQMGKQYLDAYSN